MNKIVLCLVASVLATSLGVSADSQTNSESKFKFSSAAVRERGYFVTAVREGRAKRHTDQSAITRLRHMHGLSFVQQLIWDDESASMRLFAFPFPKATYVDTIAPALGTQPPAESAWFEVKVGAEKFEYAARRYEVRAPLTGQLKLEILRVQREYSNSAVRVVIDDVGGRKFFLHYADRVARIVELPNSIAGDVIGFHLIGDHQLEVTTSKLTRHKLAIDPDSRVRELHARFGSMVVDLAEVRVGEHMFQPCAAQLTTPR